jgi:hypothetical protein
MFQTITANRTGSYRKEHLSGRNYLVTSVRMIVPGVLTGNRGALLYPPEEIKKSISAWNGMPIVVNHPKEGQRFISARNPKVLASVGVGFVFNASMESGNLDAEAWIDEAKIAEVSPELLAKIKKNEPVEVSTGLGTENQPRKGNFNGKDFDHVARNYAPDHLALLPSEKGACSLEDGCGLAVNKKDYHKWVRAYDKSGSNKSFSVWSRTANVEESGEDCHCKGKCDECKTKGTVNFQPTNNVRVRNNVSWKFQTTVNAEGVWRTTDDGSRIFIKDGEAYAGGPNGPQVGGKSKGKGKGTTTKKQTEKGGKSSELKGLVDPTPSGKDTLYSPLSKVLSNLDKEGKSLDAMSDDQLLRVVETAIQDGMKRENRIRDRKTSSILDQKELKVIRSEKQKLWNWANSILKVVPFSDGESTPSRKPLKPIKPKSSSIKSKGRGIFKKTDTPSDWYLAK